MPMTVIFFMVDGAPRWRLQRHQPGTSHLMPSVGAVHHITFSHCCRTLAAVNEANGTALVRRLSLPARNHPAGYLALSSLHTEPQRRRGAAGRARYRCLPRNDPTLGGGVRT